MANGTPYNLGGNSSNPDVIVWNGGLLNRLTGQYYPGYGPNRTGPAYTAPSSPGGATNNEVSVWVSKTGDAISSKAQPGWEQITASEARKRGLI